MAKTISAAWMRGGTSKCWVFERDELEAAGPSVDDVLLRVYGSPDPRQLDGIGGGTSTTSKAVILAPSEAPDVDVEYTFAQVGIEEAAVDWGSNCGNCSAVVAPYALERGWVRPAGDETVVRVRNTNTGQVIWQRLATPGGRWEPRLDTEIPGVAFPGTGVGLGFLAPAGRTTGALLPTGEVIDRIAAAGEDVEATLVDAGAPLVIVSPETAGLAGTPFDRWPALDDDALARLDAIRRAGAVRMGLASTPGDAHRAIPKLAIVGRPTGEGDVDAMMLSMGRPHPALAITGAVGLTVAASIPGSVVARALGAAPGADLAFRTPAGLVTTWRRTIEGNDVVGTTRTARLIARSDIDVPAMAPAVV